MNRKRAKDWPPFGPPSSPPPPPRGDDGPARWVTWLPEVKGECGHTGFWRDQYLRLHCGVCEPVTAGKQGSGGAGERGRKNLLTPAPLPPSSPAASEAVQLRLF